MRGALVLTAIVALVAIGTAEAWISNDQLAQLPGRARPVIGAGGAFLTLASVALSIAVYVALGVALARRGDRESAALTAGMLAGAGAGLVGGTIRAYLIRDYLGEVLASYGLAELLLLTLAVFVAVAVVVSVAAGATATWLGFRAGRRPPRPRPPS